MVCTVKKCNFTSFVIWRFMSVKKNIFYSVLLNVVNMVFPIVTVPYISRVLGVSNIGVVNFALTYVSYFVLFAALGVNLYGVRELAKYKHDQEKGSQIFSELFRITSISTLVATLLFLATIFTIPELQANRAILAIAGISLYFTPVSMDWYFQGRENFKIITIRSLVIKVVAFASLFIFVRQREDVIPYLLISAFSMVGAHIWNLLYAYGQGLRICLANLNIRQHVKPMFVFLGSNVAISIFIMLDVLMLGFLSTYEEVGYFTSANKILMLIMMSFAAINTALLPRLSENNHKNDHAANNQLLQKTFDLTALFIIPVAIGLCLIASRFVPLFFGGEFVGSILPMQILSFKVIVVMINSFFSLNILMAFGNEKKVLIATICTALLSLALNLLLIPRYGAVGASAVAVAAEGFQIGLLLYFVYKYTQVRVRWSAMGTAVLFTLPFFVLYYFCTKLIAHNLAFLCVFVCSAVVVYFALLLITKNYLMQQLIEIVVGRIKRHAR